MSTHAIRTFKSGAAVLAFPVARQSLRIAKLFGYYTGGANAFIQIHTTTLDSNGKPAAPTDQQVPVLSFPLNATYEYAESFFVDHPLVPGPVWIGVSTTEATYTAAFAGSEADIFVNVEQFEEEAPALTTASAASANILSVWSNAQAPHRLYDVLAIDLNQNAGLQLFLMLFAKDTGDSQDGDYPVQSWPIPKAGSTIPPAPTAAMPNALDQINLSGALLLNFGNSQQGGKGFQQQGGTIGNGNSTAIKQACFLAISTNPTTLKTDNLAAGSAKITARYV